MRSCSAVDRIVQERRMAHWLLQCNPRTWRVYDFFEAGEELTSWSVHRYQTAVAAGDDFVLWLSGPNGGVGAIGEVTGPPEEVEGGDEYWLDEEKSAKVRRAVPIHIVDEFVLTPI